MYSIVYSMCFLYSIGVPSLRAVQNRVCKAKASNARKGAGGTITTLLELQNFTQPLLMGPLGTPCLPCGGWVCAFRDFDYHQGL